MATLSDVLFVATAAAYLFASGVFLAYLAGSTRVTASKFGPWFLGVGALLHATHIVVSSLVLHVCPVEGVHFALSVLSLCACVVYLAVRVRYRVDVVGAFVAPLALTFLTASRFVAVTSDESSQAMRSAILPLHVTVNLLGDALFTLAFGAAVAYLLQERQLKKKQFSGLFQRLPPLDALDKAEHRFLLAGFPLLTIGILTGTIWARRVELGGAADVARAAFGYATWLLFAGVLLMRAAAGWRGRRAAYGTIAGFGLSVIVLLIYLFRTTSSQVALADALSHMVALR